MCYRADSPQSLVDRQAECWDPALDWAAATLDARLFPRVGVMHEPQDPRALSAIQNKIDSMTVFELTGLHDLVMLSGSAVLGLAAALNWRTAADIWTMSILDEIWQEEQWGRDDEARNLSQIKKAAFLHAKSVFDLS